MQDYAKDRSIAMRPDAFPAKLEVQRDSNGFWDH